MSAILPKPWKYKDYLIWPNTAIDNMDKNRVGCSDTIEGVCNSNLTVQECIDKSTDGFGYHVQFKNGNSICVPLRTSEYPDINVVYKLVNQNNHDKLKNVSVSTFIDTKKYIFPPLKSDILFYFDVFLLKNNETRLILSDKDLNDNTIDFLPNNDHNINIQIIPKYTFIKQLENYTKILYDTEFNIIIEGTSLFLSFDNINNKFIWKYSTVDEITAFFKIIPLDSKGKYYKDKLNNSIDYKDTFTIIYDNIIILTLTSDNILSGEYNDISKLVDRDNVNIKNTFSIISKMGGYYCKGNTCTPISLEKDLYNSDKDLSTTYNSALVCRNKDCWGVCKYWDEKTNSIPPYSTIQPPFKFQTINNNKGLNCVLVTMLILFVILALYFMN